GHSRWANRAARRAGRGQLRFDSRDAEARVRGSAPGRGAGRGVRFGRADGAGTRARHAATSPPRDRRAQQRRCAMNDDYFADVLPVADAILYEGYLLYPYRASTNKQKIRWNFGGVYPRSYSDTQSGADRWEVGSECIAIGAAAALCVEVRFLELLEQGESEPFEAARPSARRHDFGTLERLAGSTVEYAFRSERLRGHLELRVERIANEQYKLGLRLRNESHCPALARDQALPETLLAAHLLLGLEGGQFVSQLDPPAAHRAAAAACVQLGLWPVLAGQRGRVDRLLLSPIILYDYPE